MNALRYGDRGEAVAVLQRKLKALGYYTDNIDSAYGPNTIGAVIRFQQVSNLDMDGVFGQSTSDALDKATALPIPTVPPPAPVETGVPKVYLPYSHYTRGTADWYRAAFQQMVIMTKYATDVVNDAKVVISKRSHYEAAEKLTGIPWWVIGGIHMKEGDCDLGACLMNGDPIIGTGQKTYHVPKGLGPYPTFESSVKDAVKDEAIYEVRDWEIGNILQAVELYNGAGYLPGGGSTLAAKENSPYLWSRTNINDGAGKYTDDNKFDPNATTLKVSGFAAIVLAMEKLGACVIKRV